VSIPVYLVQRNAEETAFGQSGRLLPIYSVETNEKKIAISFDAAWGAEDFNQIMEVLDKHQVKTTFFMTGEWVEKYPECVKTLVEKGHDLGNHSASHPDMTKLSKEKQKEQILKVHSAVKELTGYEMELFRPPYGAYSNDVIRTCYELNYYPIQWDVDSLDWKGLSSTEIINKVCNHKSLGPGSIILCHNGADHTAEALDEMLTNLKNQGYELVPISELIMRDNYHMDVTGMQVAD
jgi:polysaccharide deacetylase family sporulation protein PdaB